MHPGRVSSIYRSVGLTTTTTDSSNRLTPRPHDPSRKAVSRCVCLSGRLWTLEVVLVCVPPVHVSYSPSTRSQGNELDLWQPARHFQRCAPRCPVIVDSYLISPLGELRTPRTMGKRVRDHAQIQGAFQRMLASQGHICRLTRSPFRATDCLPWTRALSTTFSPTAAITRSPPKFDTIYPKSSARVGHLM